MKKLLLDQVSLNADGSIDVKFLKVLTDPDTGEVLLVEPNREKVGAGSDVATIIDDKLTALATKGYSADEESADRIRLILEQVEDIAEGDPEISAVREAARNAVEPPVGP